MFHGFTQHVHNHIHEICISRVAAKRQTTILDLRFVIANIHIYPGCGRQITLCVFHKQPKPLHHEAVSSVESCWWAQIQSCQTVPRAELHQDFELCLHRRIFPSLLSRSRYFYDCWAPEKPWARECVELLWQPATARCHVMSGITAYWTVSNIVMFIFIAFSPLFWYVSKIIWNNDMIRS